MISVQRALDLVLSQTLPKETEELDILSSRGKILAAPIKADRDAPPFDRVTMDGIAIRFNALQESAAFKIENIQPAGSPQIKLSQKECCIEVMTGAILPIETDCVIPYEQIKIKEGIAYIDSKHHTLRQNIHFKGRDARQGDILLDEGQVITPSVIGVLASVGIGKVKVLKTPGIAICSTGDELVDIDQQPAIHQIRKSNAYMLQSALLDMGIEADIFHLKDDKEAMLSELSPMISNYRVLLFSGAVSKGKYDFLPAVLEELGMEKLVHGVAQRPGKPFLFGRFANTVVFGFPGNPASTLVCFHSYFKPWLRNHQGLSSLGHTAVLGQDVQFNKPLTYHLLVTLSLIKGSLVASPLQSSGSGDLVHLADADAVISLPPDRDNFRVGEYYPVNLLSINLL